MQNTPFYLKNDPKSEDFYPDTRVFRGIEHTVWFLKDRKVPFSMGKTVLYPKAIINYSLESINKGLSMNGLRKGHTFHLDCSCVELQCEITEV